jgi:hypothetical protein
MPRQTSPRDPQAVGVDMGKPRMTTHRTLQHEGACAEWGTPWSRSSATPPALGHEHVLLWFCGNSSADLFWGKGHAGCRWLAPHHRIKVQLVTLHRVPENSLCHTTAERSSKGLVGIIYRSATSRSPCGMGWVSRRIPWSPLLSGHCASQAGWVSRVTPGEPFCVWLHSGV